MRRNPMEVFYEQKLENHAIILVMLTVIEMVDLNQLPCWSQAGVYFNSYLFTEAITQLITSSCIDTHGFLVV